MKNGLLENYAMEDLSFEDYPKPSIMQMAIFVQRKTLEKQYPGCEIEVVHYSGFVRIIAHEPEEVDSFTLYHNDFAKEDIFLMAVEQYADFLKETYPKCKIIKEQVPLGTRIVAKN